MSTEPVRPLLPLSTLHAIEPEILDAEILDEEIENPVIPVDVEHRVVTRTLALLAAHCHDLYQRLGMLVHLVAPTRSGILTRRPEITEASELWLRDRISRVAKYQVRSLQGWRINLVPNWLPGMIIKRREFPDIPTLLSVVEAPVFLSDGRVLEAPGYDPISGLLVMLGQDSVRVSDQPTHADAVRAKDELLQVVADFPFALDPTPDAHRAAWVAALLTIVGRYAIEGPVPGFMVDASGPASGKGMLIQVTHIIATGRHASAMPCSADKEELRRTIGSVLMVGRRVGWLDEVTSPFGGGAWNALATAWPTWSDRTIRTSNTPEYPALTCWIISGNNIRLTSDTTRRTLVVRLEPSIDRPEDRSGFKHPQLLQWVQEEQPRLIAAALTILRAFHAAGRPTVFSTPIGSYEAWDALVRQAVGWVMVVDPMAPRNAMAAIVDPRRRAWEDLVDELWGMFGTGEFTARDAVVELGGSQATEAGAMAVEELMGGKAVTPRTFATTVLSAHRGVVAHGLRLEIANPHSNRGVVFRLVRLPKPGGNHE